MKTYQAFHNKHNFLDNWIHVQSKWLIRTRSSLGHLCIYRSKDLHVLIKYKECHSALCKVTELIKKSLNTGSITIWAHIMTKTHQSNDMLHENYVPKVLSGIFQSNLEELWAMEQKFPVEGQRTWSPVVQSLRAKYGGPGISLPTVEKSRDSKFPSLYLFSLSRSLLDWIILLSLHWGREVISYFVHGSQHISLPETPSQTPESILCLLFMLPQWSWHRELTIKQLWSS